MGVIVATTNSDDVVHVSATAAIVVTRNRDGSAVVTIDDRNSRTSGRLISLELDARSFNRLIDELAPF